MNIADVVLLLVVVAMYLKVRKDKVKYFSRQNMIDDNVLVMRNKLNEIIRRNEGGK